MNLKNLQTTIFIRKVYLNMNFQSSRPATDVSNVNEHMQIVKTKIQKEESLQFRPTISKIVKGKHNFLNYTVNAAHKVMLR